MAAITVTVEVQFNGSAWVDISNRTTRARIGYGRKRTLGQFSTGTASVVIDNRDNFLTPGHSDSTYGNTQLINRQIKISARVTGGSDSYNTYLWRGFISDVDYQAGQGTRQGRTASHGRAAGRQATPRGYGQHFRGRPPVQSPILLEINR